VLLNRGSGRRESPRSPPLLVAFLSLRVRLSEASLIISSEAFIRLLFKIVFVFDIFVVIHISIILKIIFIIFLLH
jgi:hypothetical protein